MAVDEMYSAIQLGRAHIYYYIYYMYTYDIYIHVH